MCGIAGFIDFSGRPADTALLRAMAGSLRHRGPDGEGVHTDGAVGLAHRRLSILDLETGAQPMTTPEGNAWIVFNGEIYNYVELREDLVRRGHPFATRSDTEVILHLYEERGLDFVTGLRGMFALALWDPAARRLVLARDRVGIKPLYYTQAGTTLVFASELKALLLHPDVRRDPDAEALSEFLTYQYVPAPRTAFRGIRKLPPAHLLVAGSGALTLRRYWAPPPATEDRTDEEWSAELDRALREAVRIHMRSDVPVGALLSGGLDSSLIVALAAESASGALRTFSVGFGDPVFSELPHARAVAERYGTRHTEHVLEPESVTSLPALVAAFDEPFADPSAIPCSRIAAVAAEQVKVCLSGDGGDEAFAGYNAYVKAAGLARWDAVPRRLRRAILGPVERLTPEWVPGKGLLRLLTATPADRYVELMGAVDLSTRDWLLTDDFMRAAAAVHPYGTLRSAYARLDGHDLVARLQRLDLETYLPDDILVKADRTSMLHSLELRVPFLDHVVLDLAFRMPTAQKLRGATRKHILRRTFGSLLPEAILTRGKQGFGIPLDDWLRGDLAACVRELFSDRVTRQRGVFRPAGLDRLLAAHGRGRRSLANEIWAVLVLELWFRHWMDRPALRSPQMASA